MHIDIFDMIERIAETGTAPLHGCSLFGVGYERAFEALKHTYIERAFKNGRSAEKYVVGAYGSGKTHFLRQLAEIGRELDCVTAEVPINKDLDYTKTHLLYQLVAKEIEHPTSGSKGIAPIIRGMLQRVREKVSDPQHQSAVVQRWIPAIESWELKNPKFGRVLRKAFEALEQDNDSQFEFACRWLSGEVTNRDVAKSLGEAPVSKPELEHYGREALLSLGQVIHKVFRGTIIGFDEAEQGLGEGIRQSRTRDKILSMLQSSINAVSDLEGGAMLVVYAITPDVWDKMSEFPALQQRVSDPGPGRGFFDDNPRAVKIPLDEHRIDPKKELTQMGLSLVQLVYEREPDEMAHFPRVKAEERVKQIANEVAETEPSVSARREVMKRVADLLASEHDKTFLAGKDNSGGIEPE